MRRRTGCRSTPPPLGHLHDLGDGRRLLLHRSGTGGPTAVFLAGAGMMSLDYLNIHRRAAERTTAVLYDRGGNGWSHPAELPRTAAEVTEELRELLHAAGVPGPCLLIGHSLGGAYARHYARCFPAEVAGLLLLDPFHEDMVVRAPQRARETLDAMLDQMAAQEAAEFTPEQVAQARATMLEHFASWPESVRGPLVDRHLATWRAAGRENQNLYDKVADELRTAPATPDVPLIVLTAMGHDATQAHLWPAELLGEINELKRRLHAEVAAGSPRGEQRVLGDAGHGWLHEERADAVLQAVEDLIIRAR
ncbi:alpha/beta hydrolase [Streptomyces sp. WAC 06725]|uniref:alpha/beta fold hydrolase n=1 Tax=Streptomyces sp. WAC 06725 TaxID=2203209 RepID=UPI000F7459D5|nr:alpha/beta hydrolase [Streptomyces sp. WAC 06725]RSO41241.1 alpha/beta hydrolase [Streptomyces sp. WAC 06725]